MERDGESVKPQRCRAHSMYYNVGGITRLYERDPIFEKLTAHNISFDTIFSLLLHEVKLHYFPNYHVLLRITFDKPIDPKFQ